MSDDRIVISSGTALSPETIANRTFAASFRGYDQAEVRVFLKRIADELAAATERESQMRESLQEAMIRAAHPELDEATLTTALGEHTARLLTNARESAAAMVSDAEARAARVLQEGEGRIARMRAEAEALLARRAEEAERLAGGLRQAADSDARSIRDRARADAQAEIEAARAHGREMVAEAKELRERMLSDLLRRRRMAETQIEQLRLAHQRLLQAYSVVRRTLDEATGELSEAEAETRPALEAVVSRSEAHHGLSGPSERQVQGPSGPSERQIQGPSGPSEREAQGPSGPWEREAQGPSGPSERGDQGPSGPSERGDQGPSGPSEPETRRRRGRPRFAPKFNPAPLPGSVPSAEPDDSREESPVPAPETAGDDVAAAPVEDPAVAGESPGTDAAPAEASTKSEQAPPAGATPPPETPAVAEHPGGVGALGGGTGTASGPPPEPKPEGSRRRRGTEGRLAPVDIAAPGEEVRVVRESDQPPSDAPAAEHEPAASGAEAAVNGGPAAASHSPARQSRRQRRGREEAEPPSGHVEELFARLRAAQQRRDAEAAAPAAAKSDAPPAQDPAPHTGAAAEAHGEPAAAPDAPPVRRPAEPETHQRHLTDEKALYRRDELLDPIDTDLSRRLKRVLQDEQNQVLDRLRRQRRPTPEATLPDLVDQTERYRSAAAPVLLQAAQSGGTFAAEASGTVATANRVDESVDGWAAELAIELITPLRERLERAIQDASADEDADATMGERLSASYRQWKLQHIEQVARHYSSAAFTRGAFAVIVDGTSLRWIVDDDGPCPDCEDNALAGPTPKGQGFPTGQVHPPAHPGCRCLLVPADV